jgi:hypothetical protein
MDENVAYVGLRSGGLMTVRNVYGNEGDWGDTRTNYEISMLGLKTPGVVYRDGVYADASQVTLEDIAYGLAGQNRFANQIPRQLTVAEHSINGSLLLERDGNYKAAMQFLFHDAEEGLGFADVHFRLKRMFADDLRDAGEIVTQAIAQKFNLGWPFDPVVHETDQKLGWYETLRLHPAKDKMFAAYGGPDFSLSDTDKKFLDLQFNQNHNVPWATMWLHRYHVVDGMIELEKVTKRTIIEFDFNAVPIRSAQEFANYHRLPMGLVKRELANAVLVDKLTFKNGVYERVR